jgi:hypothetical protein
MSLHPVRKVRENYRILLIVALMHLCEFIEDCEYNNLAVRILHLLGTEGPKTEKPSRFIRYIYNRVVLENAIVRAAAVTALAKFGAWEGAGQNVKNSIKVLLTRCLDDPEDEVRDRAALNLKLLDNKEAAQKFINNGTLFLSKDLLIQIHCMLSQLWNKTSFSTFLPRISLNHSISVSFQWSPRKNPMLRLFVN